MAKNRIVTRCASQSTTMFLTMTLCVLLIILVQIYWQRQQYQIQMLRSGKNKEGLNDIACLSMKDFVSTSDSLEDLIAETAPKLNRSALSFCPEQPPYLVGKMNITQTVTLGEITNKDSFKELSFGGRYVPPNCTARERTAIIIPYRDRKVHLEIIVHHLHIVLQRQQLEYGIYVVEMALPTQFNRGLLANAGVVTVRGISDYTCYIIHDVDVLMTDDRNLYRCGRQPIHFMTGSTNYKNNGIPYADYYGAVVGFTKEQYKKCNGFSNLYFGWGGEDDDLGIRVNSAGMQFVRPKEEIGKYVALPHDGDASNQKNPDRYTLLNHAKERWTEDGLETVIFKRFALEYRKLYTWILIGVQEDTILKVIRHFLENLNYKQSNVPYVTDFTSETAAMPDYSLCTVAMINTDNQTILIIF